MICNRAAHCPWLQKCCPAHGTHLRWRDKVRKDLKNFTFEKGSQYKVAQDRNKIRTEKSMSLPDRKRPQERHMFVKPVRGPLDV